MRLAPSANINEIAGLKVITSCVQVEFSATATEFHIGFSLCAHAALRHRVEMSISDERRQRRKTVKFQQKKLSYAATRCEWTLCFCAAAELLSQIAVEHSVYWLWKTWMLIFEVFIYERCVRFFLHILTSLELPQMMMTTGGSGEMVMKQCRDMNTENLSLESRLCTWYRTCNYSDGVFALPRTYR